MNHYHFNVLKTNNFLLLIAKYYSSVIHIEDTIAFTSVQNLSEVEQFIYARYLINQHYLKQGADVFATNEDTQLYSMGSSRGANMILLAQESYSVGIDYDKLKNVDDIYPIGYITCENTASEMGILKYIELQLPSITRMVDDDADYATALRLQLDENYIIQASDNSDNVACFVDKYKYLIDGICDFLKDKPLDVPYSYYPPTTRIENVATWLVENN